MLQIYNNLNYKQKITKYYKYKIRDFKQPVLQENGSLGEDSFAVWSDSFSPESVYHVFDGNRNQEWAAFTTKARIKIYNPNLINIKQIDYYSPYSSGTDTGVIYGSNQDDFDLQESSKKELLSFSVTHSENNHTINLDTNEEYFKYYLIDWTKTEHIGSGGGGWHAMARFSEIILTASEKIISNSTQDDFDYSEIITLDNSGWAVVEKGKKYFKYQEQDFIQPILTENGSLAGSNFAVSASGNYTDFYPWKAFDNNENTSWQSSETSKENTYFIFYNPNPLKVTKLTTSGTCTYGYITAGIIWGSNDNIEWENIKQWSFEGENTGIIDLSDNQKYYNYYKITPSEWTDNSGTWTNGFANLTVSASEKISKEVSKNDNYDYSIDVPKVKLIEV